MSTPESDISFYEFNSYDEQDISYDGFTTIYYREVPFEIRHYEDVEKTKLASVSELLKVKILIAGDENTPEEIRLELLNENNLFFHYYHDVKESNFSNIQNTQKLVISFNDYPSILIQMFNNCIKNPYNFICIFTIDSGDNESRLDFIQNMEYKYVDLMYCTCIKSTEIMIENQITNRYKSIKNKLNFYESRFHEFINFIKIKNPSLLLQLQKNFNASSNNLTSNTSKYGK